MKLQIHELAGEDHTKRPISYICAAEFLEHHDNRHDLVLELLLEDAVLEALRPIEVKVDQIVLLERQEDGFQTFTAKLGLLVVVSVEFLDERDVKLSIIDRFQDHLAFSLIDIRVVATLILSLCILRRSASVTLD